MPTKTNSKKLNVSYNITLEHFDNIICAALEGGSNYWCKLKFSEFRDQLQDRRDNENPNGLHTIEKIALTLFGNAQFYFNVYDCVSNELIGKVSQKSFLRGLRIAARKYPQIFQKLLEEQFDAGDADTIFQLAAMGKVVYG
jgi:hypothetical protein